MITAQFIVGSLRAYVADGGLTVETPAGEGYSTLNERDTHRFLNWLTQAKEQVLLREKFEEWLKANGSPGADSSIWYWNIWVGGAKAQKEISK